MFVDIETKKDFEKLIKKAVEANSKMLDGIENLHHETRLQVLGSITYNIESLAKTINS